MKTQFRKFMFILSAIVCGLGALFIFVGGICVGIAKTPDLSYPLTSIIPLLFFIVLDALLILLPIILFKYWKSNPCKPWWIAFFVLLALLLVFFISSRPINLFIQENNIMYVPHNEAEPSRPSITTTTTTTNANANTSVTTKTKCLHEFKETLIKEATEKTQGEKQFVCKKCGHSYTEEIPMLESVLTETTITKKEEILFRDIPWGTTSKNVKKFLKNKNSSVNFSLWEKGYILYPDTMLDSSSFDGLNEGGTVIYAHKLTAGGYDIQTAQLHFAYKIQAGKIDRNTDSLYAALYYFDVVEHEFVYKDLQQKMIDLYGNGKEICKTKTGLIAGVDYSGKYEYVINQTTWYGDNNTFVTLQWVSSTNQAESVQNGCGVSMLYGKTDADSMLDDLKEALKQEKANADRENAADNNAGL